MANLIKRSGQSFFDDFFDDFFSYPTFNRTTGNMKTDIVEAENGYELDIDVPGYDKEDIKISLDNGYLTVEAKKEEENEEKERHYVRRERFLGSCARSFYVGEDIAEEDITANYEKGLLKLFIPKEGTNVKEKKYIEIE